MKHAKLAVILLACPALFACGPGNTSKEASAAESTPPTLEGVWHTTRIHVETGPNAGPHTVDVQPALYLFSKTHYAITAVNGFQARPYLGEKPSDEEQGLAFTPFTGNAGAYTSDAGKLTLTPQVAKNPGNMIVPQPIDRELEWADGKMLLSTSTPEGGRITTELTRLREDAINVTPEAQRLKGVWRRVEMNVGAGPDAGSHLEDMQPGLYIFDPPFFSGNFVSAFAPRLALSETATDADRGKAFAPFASFAGTYTVSEDDLIFRPLVSMNPNNMRGRPFQPIKVEWADPDVWFIYTNASGVQNRVRLTPVAD